MTNRSFFLIFAMMTDIEKIVKKLTFVSTNIDSISSEAVRNSSKIGIEEQKSQMLKGINADGVKIGTYRSTFYKQLKQEMNPSAGGFVDLKLTGAFHNAIKLDVNTTEYSFTSTDSKTEQLLSKYGEAIFGLFGSWDKKFKEEVGKNINSIIKKI